MTYGAVNPNRAVSGGVPVPHPHAFNDPPLMDMDYGDLRCAERISLDTASKYGINLDIQYMSGTGTGLPSSQTELGVGRSGMHRQYINSSTNSGIAQVVRGDNTLYDFSLSGSTYEAQGRGITTSLTFDGSEFHEYYPDGTRLDYAPQVNSGTEVVCRLIAINDVNSNRTTLNYGTGAELGLLTSIELPNQNLITYNYMPGPAGYPVSLLSSIQDFGGRLYSYAYDNGGCCTTVQFPSGCVREYSYSPGPYVSQLNSMTTEQGYTTSYAGYPLSNSGTPASGSSGTGTWSFTFSQGGVGGTNSSAVIYPTGAAMTYHFDRTLGFTVSIAHPEGYTETITNDPNGLVLQRKTPAGTVQSVTYDRYSMVYQSDDPLGNRTTYLRDGVGNLTTLIDAGGNTWTQIFDANRNLTVAIDPLGRPTSMTYDGHGQMLSRQDGRGLTTTFAWDAHGNNTTQVNSDGGVVTRIFDSLGRKIAETDPIGRTTSWGFDASDNVVSVMNALGEQSLYVYNSCLLVASVTPLGNRTSYSYGRFNNQVTRQDPLGNVWSMAYDSAGYQVSTTDPTGGVSTTVYNAAHQTIASLNQLGYATSYFYDSAARPLATQNARGFTTTNVYNARDLIAVENALGQITTSTLDALGRTVSVTNALNLTNQTIFDAAGQQIASVDSGGYRTSFFFDQAGNQTAVQDGNGHLTSSVFAANSNRAAATVDATNYRTSFTWDLAGQQVAVQNPRGFTSSTVYDLAGRVEASIDALGQATTNYFDNDGRRTATQDPLNHTTSFYFDAAARQIAVENALGFVNSTVFDSLSRVVAQVDPLGHRFTTAFDLASRVVSTQNPLGYLTSFASDANGNRIQTQDANGNLSSVVFDALDRVSVSIDPLNYATTQTYNAAEQPLATFDPRGHAVTMLYNNRGRVSGIQNELGYLRSVTFDGAANPLVELSFGSQAITNVYDAANRRLARQYMNGTAATWQYDANSNVIQSIAPATQYSTTFGFDALDRVVGRTDPGSLSVSMAYDAASRRTQLLDPSGGLHQFTWTSDDQLASIVRPDEYTDSLGYDAAGRYVTMSATSGLRYTLTYDAASQITSVQATSSSALLSTTYMYDPVGNRTNMRTLSGSNSTYSYDALTQDNTSGTNAHDYTFTFDSVRNRLSSTDSGLYVAYSFDAASRLTTSVGSSGTTTYGYSMEGTKTSVQEPPGGNLYTFAQDVEYRLASQTATPGGTRNWSYDADGKLQYFSGPSPAGTTTLIWDGSDYLQIRSATTITNYFSGNGQIFGEKSVGGLDLDYVPDALGSVVAVVDQNLNTTYTAAYKPWGDVLAWTGTQPYFTWVGSLGYLMIAGRPYAEYSVRARFYSSKTSRWMSVDSLWPGLPAYAYVRVSPTQRVDPTGRSCCSTSGFKACVPGSISIGDGTVCSVTYDKSSGHLKALAYRNAPMTCEGTCAQLQCFDCHLNQYAKGYQQSEQLGSIVWGPKGLPVPQVPHPCNTTKGWCPDFRPECGTGRAHQCLPNWTIQGLDAPGLLDVAKNPKDCTPVAQWAAPIDLTQFALDTFKVNVIDEGAIFTMNAYFETCCACSPGPQGQGMGLCAGWEAKLKITVADNWESAT